MEPMSLLAWIVVGLIAGWLASQVVPSRFGVVGDTIIGMLGALVGGFLFEQFGSTGTTGLSICEHLRRFCRGGGAAGLDPRV